MSKFGNRPVCEEVSRALSKDQIGNNPNSDPRIGEVMRTHSIRRGSAEGNEPHQDLDGPKKPLSPRELKPAGSESDKVEFGKFKRMMSICERNDDHFFLPMELTPKTVQGIQHLGGTILGSTRGGFDLAQIMAFIKANKISIMFICGGDGTHRGAYKVAMEVIRQQMNVSVVGIPKTIDNDIAVIDRSFGFLTAVEEARKAIIAAKVEARSNMPYGIGVVKLMGRHAGFITAHACIAASGVDLCLVPEVPVVLEGERFGCLPHLGRVLDRKGYAIVVVAEGAGEELFADSDAEVDKSGNKKLPQIGEFMCNAIKTYFKKEQREVTVKYIDPSYMIRSVPANATDSYECTVLAQGAVHGAMSGLTGFTVGMVNAHSCFIPIPLIESQSPRTMNKLGRTWERILGITKQPNTVRMGKEFLPDPSMSRGL